MAVYRIINTISGVDLGIFVAGSEGQALDAMARDAGYRNRADAESIAPTLPGELVVSEVVAEEELREVTEDDMRELADELLDD